MKHPMLPEDEYADARDEWTECPQCRSVMLPLKHYEINRGSEFPVVEAEAWEFFVWGWGIFVYNFLTALVTYEGRRRRLAALKRGALPRFPNSFVCPRCLSVATRT